MATITMDPAVTIFCVAGALGTSVRLGRFATAAATAVEIRE